MEMRRWHDRLWNGCGIMTHDIDPESDDEWKQFIRDMYSYVLKLEERIIELEKCLGNTQVIHPSDSYYWEHG